MVRPLSQRNLSHLLGTFSRVPLPIRAPQHPDPAGGPAAPNDDDDGTLKETGTLAAPEAHPRPSRCPSVPRSAQTGCGAWGVPARGPLKRWRSSGPAWTGNRWECRVPEAIPCPHPPLIRDWRRPGQSMASLPVKLPAEGSDLGALGTGT
jgi:hypothetical protein